MHPGGCGDGHVRQRARDDGRPAQRVAQLRGVAEGRRSDDAAALDVDVRPVVAIEEHYGIGTEALQTVDEGGDGAEALADLHDDGDGDAAAHVF